MNNTNDLMKPGDCVYDAFVVVGRYRIPNNGCCKERDVLITEATTKQGTAYSCQCACGGWCTTGCSTIEKAVQSYNAMCKAQ